MEYLGYEGQINHNGTHWFSMIRWKDQEVGVVEAGTKEELERNFRSYVLHYHMQWIDKELKELRIYTKEVNRLLEADS